MARAERKAATVRMDRPVWRRLKRLSIDRETSEQRIIALGLNMVLEAAGAPERLSDALPMSDLRPEIEHEASSVSASIENPAAGTAGLGALIGQINQREEYRMLSVLSRQAEPTTARFGPKPLELVIHEGRMTIPPELAKRILAETNYSRQRRVKPYRLHRHAQTIARGQWDPDCTIRFALLNGRLVLVDGQHRMNAVVETNAAQPFIVIITPVSSEAELHTTYSRIDVDGNRSVADALLAADPTAGREISAETRRKAYFAMDNLANDFPHRKLLVGENDLVTKEDRIVCLSFWLDELETYDQIITKSQPALKKRLRTAGVMAVALATLKHQRERAKLFWSAVGRNSGLEEGDPEQALVTFLLTAALNDGFRHAERGAAQAWNSWFKGTRLKSVKKDPNSERPIRIVGTPYQGRA